ncbi:Hypothetical protein PHPALM_5869 [Phytophthora palmivora]|uniref:Uncharacterized protein n=1 Tax=Phytophthora palmivora TaxID=4796 RepID=A0A2P4YGA6_9STRA|nr:Hypothetical protein PHPALM_5869 [Phytophthora palmivora]
MEALRTENVRLTERVREHTQQLADARNDYLHERNASEEDLRRHHTERITLINSIGDKIDGLLTSHTSSRQLWTSLTEAPIISVTNSVQPRVLLNTVAKLFSGCQCHYAEGFVMMCPYFF